MSVYTVLHSTAHLVIVVIKAILLSNKYIYYIFIAVVPGSRPELTQLTGQTGGQTCDMVSSVSLSLSHWYPGSGVVLDCIDS